MYETRIGPREARDTLAGSRARGECEDTCTKEQGSKNGRLLDIFGRFALLSRPSPARRAHTRPGCQFAITQCISRARTGH